MQQSAMEKDRATGAWLTVNQLQTLVDGSEDKFTFSSADF